MARETEEKLKEEYKCDLIICVSHLGYKYEDDKVSDVEVARATSLTNIIIGGHTHTLLDPPARIRNREGMDVAIGQAGYGGAYVGRMEVFLDRKNGNSFVESYTINL